MSMLRATGLIAGTLLLLGNALADPATDAGSEPTKVEVNIDAQPLTAALNKWAEQTRMMVMAPAEGEGLLAPRVVGNFTPEEALIRLLRKSGYRYEFVNARTVAVHSGKEASTSFRKTSSATRGWTGVRLAQADAAQSDAGTQPDSSSTDTKAAPALEEIVVTAQKREERIQDVPASIAALSGDFLNQSRVDALDELSRVVAGIGINLRGEGTLGQDGTIAMRGISTVTFSRAQDASVGVVRDGVVLGRPAMAFTNFSDIERIEVLRGPQGTLFGMNASAGLLNIVTKDPTSEPSANLGVSYGTYNETRIHGAVSGPLIGDTLLGRLSFFTGKRDGYVTNTFIDDGSKRGADDQWGVHGKLIFLPREETRIALNLEWVEREGIGVLTAARALTPLASATEQSLDGPFASETNVTNNINFTGNSHNRMRGVSLQWDESIGDHTLTSITAWRDWEVGKNVAPILVVPGLFTLFHGNLDDQNQVSEELRIASPTGGFVDYVAGLFVFKQRWKFGGFFNIDLTPIGFPIALVTDNEATVDTLNTAVFGEANIHVTDSITLIAGTRWTRDEREMHLVGFPLPAIPGVTVVPFLTPPGTTDDSVSTTNWSWRGGIRWNPNEGNMVYATASRGFKGPGFNTNSGITGVSQRVNPEIATNYELGWKTALWSNRVRANVALFFTQFDDFQAEADRLTTLPSGQVISSFVLTNAAEIESKGVEFELEAVPLENLAVDFNVAYIDAKFKEFPNAACYFPQSAADGCVGGVQDLAGRRLPVTPKWSFNVSGRYDIPISGMPFNGFVRADYSWRDEVQWDLAQDPFTIEDAYGHVGASVGIQDKDGRYTLRIFGKNLTDKFHTSAIAGGTTITHDIPRDYQAIFGVAFDYQFF